MTALALSLITAVMVAACSTIPPMPTSSTDCGSDCGETPASLTMDATGLGPCAKQWYMSCNYGIRVEGPGGYDHRGNFAWDQGVPPPGPEPAHGPNGPVASTGIWGDVPATLGPGVWTISFRLWYGSDAIQLEPVPGGTPRYAEEDPFTAACSTTVDTAVVTDLALHVAFQGSACAIAMQISPSSSTGTE